MKELKRSASSFQLFFFSLKKSSLSLSKTMEKYGIINKERIIIVVKTTAILNLTVRMARL